MAKAISRKTSSVGAEMLQRLNGFADALASRRRLSGRFTIREVEIAGPTSYRPAQVKAIRESLNMSQAVFALAMGVSTELVRSWESDKRAVGPLAARLLEMVETDPKRFLRKICVMSGVSTKMIASVR